MKSLPRLSMRPRNGRSENCTTRRATSANSSAMVASARPRGRNAVDGWSVLVPTITVGTERQQQRPQSLRQRRLRRRPARLPPQIREHRDDEPIARPRQYPDRCRRNRIDNGFGEPHRPPRLLHLRRIDRLRDDDTIGLPLLEIAGALQQPGHPAVGFVEAGQQDAEQFGAPVAFDLGEPPSVRDVFGGDDGADCVGILDGKIGDGGDRRLDPRRCGGDGGITQPMRQLAMAATVGMQDRVEREMLLGAQPRMGPHELEIADRTTAEEPQNFVDMIGEVLVEARQHLRIAGSRERRDFVQHRLAQRRSQPPSASPRVGEQREE